MRCVFTVVTNNCSGSICHLLKTETVGYDCENAPMVTWSIPRHSKKVLNEKLTSNSDPCMGAPLYTPGFILSDALHQASLISLDTNDDKVIRLIGMLLHKTLVMFNRVST